jgi:hypothetical protein
MAGHFWTSDYVHLRNLFADACTDIMLRKLASRGVGGVLKRNVSEPDHAVFQIFEFTDLVDSMGNW